MRNRLLFLILTFFFVSNLFAEGFQVIRWNEIELAYGYTVEIKDELGQSKFENSREPVVKVKLSQGVYKYRIAVLNKFKRIEKWSDWNQFEVRPVVVPVIEEGTTVVESVGDKEKITFKSEGIYQGTKAYIEQNGKKIPVVIDTARDGQSSVITINKKFVDKTKPYKIIIENPKQEPVALQVSIDDEVAIVDEKPSKPEPPKETAPLNQPPKKVSEYNGAIWPLFWRQMLLPGWGHSYHGDKLTAYTYFALFGLTSLNAASVYKDYTSYAGDFRTTKDTLEGIRFLDPNAAAFPFVASSLVEEYYLERLEVKANHVRSAIETVGIVYLVSLTHILITSYTSKPAEQKSQNFDYRVSRDEPTSVSRTVDPNQMRMDVRYNFYF